MMDFDEALANFSITILKVEAASHAVITVYDQRHAPKFRNSLTPNGYGDSFTTFRSHFMCKVLFDIGRIQAA